MDKSVIDKELKRISSSYDNTIELGKKGICEYDNLNDEIINNKYFYLFLEMKKNNNLSSSDNKKIYDFLNPNAGMKFIDFGCSLNLMFKGYDKWKSYYFGIDISNKTIELLNNYTKKNKINCNLVCSSIHKTPFEDNYFNIGCCIGSLEYYEKEFVLLCIKEFNRVIKSNGKLVIDIPNINTRNFEITSLIEKSLNREDKFNYSVSDFEKIITKYFHINKKLNVGPMIEYFLIKKV